MSAPLSLPRGFTPWPRHIGTQIAALVILAALFTYAGNLALMKSFELPPNGGAEMMMNGNILFAALPVLAETVPEKRQAIVDLVNLMAPRLDLSIDGSVAIPADARPFGDPAQRPGGQAAPGNASDPHGGAALYSLGETTVGTNRLGRILAVLPDGSGVRALLPLPPVPPSAFFSPQFMMGNWLVLLVVILPIALVWAVMSVARPLRRFARAAEEFNFDGPHTPLEETGPEEIRVAARALNSMRRRIAVMAADRTRMLSAVGHDLRTPVTRMRLRAEFVEDQDIRVGQLRDLARMEAMIDNTLSFLRDGQVQGTRAPTDLVSLMQALIDDFSDLGAEISLTAPERLVCTVEPDAIRRMVENLVQNGLKFGKRVTVGLEPPSGGFIEVRVEDDGPGIAAAERSEMLKPFVTGDAARSDMGAGFGLGLSIAETIARAHGGALELRDSALGGLLVRVTLPRG